MVPAKSINSRENRATRRRHRRRCSWRKYGVSNEANRPATSRNQLIRTTGRTVGLVRDSFTHAWRVPVERREKILLARAAFRFIALARSSRIMHEISYASSSTYESPRKFRPANYRLYIFDKIQRREGKGVLSSSLRRRKNNHHHKSDSKASSVFAGGTSDKINHARDYHAARIIAVSNCREHMAIGNNAMNFRKRKRTGGESPPLAHGFYLDRANLFNL